MQTGREERLEKGIPGNCMGKGRKYNVTPTFSRQSSRGFDNGPYLKMVSHQSCDIGIIPISFTDDGIEFYKMSDLLMIIELIMVSNRFMCLQSEFLFLGHHSKQCNRPFQAYGGLFINVI